ncbi:cation channel sperm-associated auxiliary subunit zeta [Apodemus sylvaticus]|uniref:cation channel sperm-associated auxiliary subunit zeta n=1 Tax=Apodemus sylvaticus TaxID=10129 RepID=UPI0022426EF2|nr:cation channel sperm-associated auxiliary subunit zeta [Apodemus sylvaticus]
MEENSIKPVPKPAIRRRSSVRSSLYGDVRDLWSTATLSTANVSVADVCEDFDEEGKSISSKLRKYSQTISLRESLNLEPQEIQQQARLELERCRSRSLENEEGQEEFNTSLGSSSSDVLVLSLLKPHRAYWTEQQNRLPLPLMELMETEVLDILKKALSTYRSTIGRSHFMTKELQGYIEGIKKRRNKRLYVLN